MKRLKRTLPLAAIGAILGFLFVLVLRGSSYEEFVAARGHGHHALHGGTVLCMGMHDAHLEVVLDRERGQLRLYPLDREGVNPLTLPAAPLSVKFRTGSSLPWTALTLEPAASGRYRPAEAWASEFTGNAAALHTAAAVELLLPDLELAGRRYPGFAAQIR